MEVVFVPETVTRIAAFGKLVPLTTRLLYGGITEELPLRWGLMTLLVCGVAAPKGAAEFDYRRP